MDEFKKILAQRSLEKRIDLIESYKEKGKKFNNLHLEKVIHEYTLTTNLWYNVLIVELASSYNISSRQFSNYLIENLTKKNHSLLKLEILQYFLSNFEACKRHLNLELIE